MKYFKVFLIHLFLVISLILFMFSLLLFYESFNDLVKLNVDRVLSHSLFANIISWFIILMYCVNKIFLSGVKK